jgi:phage baseplate assembly protein W
MAKLTSKNMFVGYSTVNTFGSQQLADIAIVNQDLLNVFYTKKNERVMMPGFGFGGWDYLFEPIDQVRDLIISEAQQVINNDPRVQLQSINVSQQQFGLSIQMTLFYVPWQAIGTFEINFDNRSAAMA